MTVKSKTVAVELKAGGDMFDLTKEAQGFVSGSGLSDGILTVFSVGSTGAVTTIEFEPGLKKDLPRALERIAPSDSDYEHHKTWGDYNGSGHIRSSVIGTSLVVPFKEKKLCLGAWQQIAVINFDASPRRREVVLQVMGE